MIWRCSHYAFDSRTPVVMGILNVTPDSFSDGGEHDAFEAAIAHAERMREEGALIIDVGGESTRPGAAPVTEAEELARVLDVVRELAARGMCVSIDTRHASVARACVEAGAAIVNDVSGFRDPAMVEVAASCDAGLVVMHMQGEPGTMQDDPRYDDVVAEVREYLRCQAARLEAAGVERSRICIDPGPGFGKTYAQTKDVVRNFQEFVHVGYPVMCAVSRKSFIGSMYGIEDPAARDDASAAEALMACELGCSVVRAHNVAATVAKLADLRPYALIGLGSNVALVANPGEEREGKIALINQAISYLCLLPDTQIVDVSSFYESKPAYYEDQEDFVNAVMAVRTALPPRELLRCLHAVEDSLGRVRTVENGPRTLDLDILDYQCYASDDEELVLPHPRLTERDFVVKPLLEIMPRHVLSDGTPVTEGTVRVGAARRIERGIPAGEGPRA